MTEEQPSVATGVGHAVVHPLPGSEVVVGLDVAMDGADDMVIARRDVDPIAVAHFHTVGERIETVNTEAVRALFGIEPPPRLRRPLFSMTVEQAVCPVVVPHKRRGLTGKRYRQARRHYRRQMRLWDRGLLAPRLVTTVFPNVGLRGVEPVPGEFGGYSIMMGVLDEWDRHSPQDAKPGYGE